MVLAVMLEYPVYLRGHLMGAAVTLSLAQAWPPGALQVSWLFHSCEADEFNNFEKHAQCMLSFSLSFFFRTWLWAKLVYKKGKATMTKRQIKGHILVPNERCAPDMETLSSHLKGSSGHAFDVYLFRTAASSDFFLLGF